MSFSGGGAAHLSGLPDGTTCSLAKRSASDETAEPVAESATVVGEGLLGAKAPRPSGRCLRQRSLASLESNLSRSFSSFPVGQNIEYRRVIGLRCFLRRWWWGKDNSSLSLLALRAVACGNVLSLALESNLSRRFLPFPLSANIVYACRGNHITVVNNGGGGRIRTFEVDDGRFTVCSLWPLGNPTTG